MVVLDGTSLTIDSVAAVAEGRAQVALATAARDRMAAAREVVREALRSGAAVYGLTTAVAERKSVVLDATASRGFSQFLIRGHLIAQGPPAPPAVVRAAMVCLVNGFAKGVAGVRPELAEMIIHALNTGRAPAVRSLGSVGQADLGPMADLAEGLLRETGFVLEENEGLALINNNAFATGWAALAELATEQLLAEAVVAAALDLEAFAANPSPLHPLVAEIRPHPGVTAIIHRLRVLLAAPCSSPVTPETCRTRSPSGASRRSSAPPGTPSAMPGPQSRPSSTPPRAIPSSSSRSGASCRLATSTWSPSRPRSTWPVSPLRRC
jgi:histidine ammonia-lyase